MGCRSFWRIRYVISEAWRVIREISRIICGATYQEAYMELRGKRVIAIGEREGVQGPSLKILAESAGAEVVFAVTQCFV